MPRFHFDTDDGARRHRDEAGIDLPSRESVPDEAMGLLRDLAHVHLPVGHRVFTVEVRDEAGTPVYRATMDIVGAWIEQSTAWRPPEPCSRRGVDIAADNRWPPA